MFQRRWQPKNPTNKQPSSNINPNNSDSELRKCFSGTTHESVRRRRKHLSSSSSRCRSNDLTNADGKRRYQSLTLRPRFVRRKQTKKKKFNRLFAPEPKVQRLTRKPVATGVTYRLHGAIILINVSEMVCGSSMTRPQLSTYSDSTKY